MDCLFCRIIAGQIPSAKVYEDEYIYAFRDINPQAPTHVLLVPKKHMPNVLSCDAETALHLTEAIGKVAAQEGVAETGFRALTNCGKEAGQTVDHLHVHLLGGKKLSDSMA
jgi:histidine triad (HIT) family protein